MSSRDKILAAVKGNQPQWRDLPGLTPPTGEVPATPVGGPAGDLSKQFIEVLEAIGGRAYIVSGWERIATILKETGAPGRGSSDGQTLAVTGEHRTVTGCPELADMAEMATRYEDPHSLENVDLAILKAHFGVAENGACWITEDRMIERVLPFIAQHLALVIHRKDIVPHMHAAYDRIGEAAYGFGTFIAGPSKTADIEQSLVLGAHGPRSMTVFLLDEELSDAGFY
jgi:L-lactate dehydrogenase complex protein LldG